MEEILASIRRIISEEDAGEPQDPLELGSERASVASVASQPMDDAHSLGSDDDLMVFDEEFEEEPAQLSAFDAPPPAMEPPAAVSVRGASSLKHNSQTDDILSEPARNAAADAFSRLSGALRISEAPGQTLEGVVRDLLRPMLKEWLDANLPAIVEARVEAELNRISRISR